MPRKYEDLTAKDKNTIRERLDAMIQELSGDLKALPEAVATEMFYRLQRHPEHARNANKTQKNRSYSHYNGICQKCFKPVERYEAKFHHLARGVKNQHGPENLLPYHVQCHNQQHGAVKGSLSKGAPERLPNKVL